MVAVSRKCGRYEEGYNYLTKFTTGDAAWAAQVTPISYTDMMALSGIIEVGDADGIRVVFLTTNGVTTPQAVITGFEPIVDSDSLMAGMIERAVTGIAMLNLTIGASPMTAGTVIKPASGTGSLWGGNVPSAAEFVTSFGAFATPAFNAIAVPGPAGNVGHIDIGWSPATADAAQPPPIEFSHLRVGLTCAGGAKSVYAVCRRLYKHRRR